MIRMDSSADLEVVAGTGSWGWERRVELALVDILVVDADSGGGSCRGMAPDLLLEGRPVQHMEPVLGGSCQERHFLDRELKLKWVALALVDSATLLEIADSTDCY